MPNKTIGHSNVQGFMLSLLAISSLQSQMPENFGGHRILGKDWSHRARANRGSRGIFDKKREIRLKQQRGG